MRRLVLVSVLVLVLGGTASGQTDKSWHFGGSSVASLAADKSLSAGYPLMNPYLRGSLAVLIALIPGVIKESTDVRFDGGDMAANTAGAITGVLLAEFTTRWVFFQYRENTLGLLWRIEW